MKNVNTSEKENLVKDIKDLCEGLMEGGNILNHYMDKLKKEKRIKRERQARFDDMMKRKKHQGDKNKTGSVGDIQKPSKGSGTDFKFSTAKTMTSQDLFHPDMDAEPTYIQRF